MKLYFATSNPGKAREAAQIVPEIEQIKIDLPEIQSLDAQEVLRAKLEAAHTLEPDKNIVVEDVTYSIVGLGGLPGTLMKWFEQAVDEQGIFEMIGDKDATTVATANIGLVKSDGEMVFVKGEVRGKTVAAKKGNGFGFDEIFIPDGHDRRWSEMTAAEKNTMSHRYRAWMALKDELNLG